MNVLLLLLPAVLAAVLSFALTPVAKRIAFAVGAIDKPDERKVHLEPIARLGGLAVLAPVVLLLLVLAPLPVMKTRTVHADLLLPLLLGLLPVFLISVVDDIKQIGALPKFAAHLFGAATAVGFGIKLQPIVHVFGNEVTIGWLAIPLSILWIAGVTNAFNIVDGLDGLSAGLALISTLSLAAVSVLVGRYEMATAALLLGGALVGFLPYNLHPARIFLGDTGAASIGFLLACMTLVGGSTLSAGMAVLVPIVVLGVPVAETLVSMTRRFIVKVEGVSDPGVFKADRRHFHHRLLDLGVDHRRAVLTLYAVGLLLAVCGFLSMLMTARHAAVMLVTLVFAAFIGIGRLGYDEFKVVRRGTVLRVYDAPLMRSAFFAVFVDLALVVFSIYASIALKFDDYTIHLRRDLAVSMIVLFPVSVLAVFWMFGIYRGAWKVASVQDFLRSSSAAVASAFVAFVSMRLLGDAFPISFAVIFMLIFGFVVNLSRVSYRILSYFNQRGADEGERVLIYGAGVAGVTALRELLANRDNRMRPIGFVDDDERKVGRMIQGYRVYGTSEDLPAIIRAEAIGGVVVSTTKLTPENVAAIRNACDAAGIWLRRFSMSFNHYSDTELLALNQRVEGWRLDVKRRPLDDETERVN